jgi:hypothetical protein
VRFSRYVILPRQITEHGNNCALPSRIVIAAQRHVA